MPMPTLQQIIGTITGKVAFERTQTNFTTIKDAHNSLETNLTTHKAENTSQFIIASRDASLSGAQVISGFNKIPKSLIINSYIINTKKHSLGSITPSSQAVFGVAENSLISADIAGILIGETNWDNRNKGVVVINSDNTITITWTKSGTLTGTIDMFILASYHD